MAVDLFLFRLQGRTYRFASGKEDILRGIAQEPPFEAAPINRRQISLRSGDSGQQTSQLTIEMERYHPFIFDCNRTGLLPEVEVFVWDGLTARRVFKGKVNKPIVLTAGSGAGTAVFEVLSLYDLALTGSYQNVGYQERCNWALYDSQTCGVDRAQHTLNTTIRSIENNGRRIVLTSTQGVPALSGASAPDGYFRGGQIKRDFGNGRKIISQAGNIVDLENPMLVSLDEQETDPNAQVSVGDNVTLYAGCDRSIETCRTVFNNQPQFGGHLTIPVRSPATQNLALDRE